jgi:hypothetical protein
VKRSGRPIRLKNGKGKPRHRSSGHSTLDIAKQIVHERDDWSCQANARGLEGYCSGVLHVHHILPRSRGGQDHVANLVCLCSFHHQRVHEQPQRSYELGLLQRSGDAECANCHHVSRLHSVTYGTCTHGQYGLECPCASFVEAA